MGINGSYSISVWVYLDGYAYLCFGRILSLPSTLILAVVVALVSIFVNIITIVIVAVMVVVDVVEVVVVTSLTGDAGK